MRFLVDKRWLCKRWISSSVNYFVFSSFFINYIIIISAVKRPLLDFLLGHLPLGCPSGGVFVVVLCDQNLTPNNLHQVLPSNARLSFTALSGAWFPLLKLSAPMLALCVLPTVTSTCLSSVSYIQSQLILWNILYPIRRHLHKYVC